MNEFAEMADHYRWTEDEIDLVELSLWPAQTPCRPLYGSYVSPRSSSPGNIVVDAQL